MFNLMVVVLVSIPVRQSGLHLRLNWPGVSFWEVVWSRSNTTSRVRKVRLCLSPFICPVCMHDWEKIVRLLQVLCSIYVMSRLEPLLPPDSMIL